MKIQISIEIADEKNNTVVLINTAELSSKWSIHEDLDRAISKAVKYLKPILERTHASDLLKPGEIPTNNT